MGSSGDELPSGPSAQVVREEDRAIHAGQKRYAPPRRRLRSVDSSDVDSSDEEVAAPVEQPTTATNDDDAALLASLRSLRRKSTLQPAAGLIRNIVSTQLNVVCTQRPVSTPSVLLLLRSNSSIVGHSWS